MALNEYVPPALYCDVVAALFVFHPTNTYPVFVGTVVLNFILALVASLYIVTFCAAGAPVPPFALYVTVTSFFHTAYNVILSLNEYVPPALYCDVVASTVVAHPANVYPVFVGAVPESFILTLV